jgi:ornithine cyclodeaminase/alanine dehydrogenase-like protein (mu-crystallin family)
MRVLVISNKIVKQLLNLPELVGALKSAYVSYSLERAVVMRRATASIDQSSIVVNMPGSLKESQCFTVKTNVKTPGNPNRGLPFLMGTISLIDRITGQPKAYFESSLITAMRTGAAGAVGVQALANPTANRVALIGAGVQGEWLLRSLHAIGRVGQVKIYDLNKFYAERLVKIAKEEFNIKAIMTSSVEEAVVEAEIVMTATTALNPVLSKTHIAAGTHINAFGADQPGKSEIADDLLKASRVCVDDKNLASTDGTFNVAYSKGVVPKDHLFPEIGEVLAKKYPGRQTSQDITIFGNVGLAFQDAIACDLIYKRAVELNLGQWVDLGEPISALVKKPELPATVKPNLTTATNWRAKL